MQIFLHHYQHVLAMACRGLECVEAENEAEADFSYPTCWFKKDITYLTMYKHKISSETD